MNGQISLAVLGGFSKARLELSSLERSDLRKTTLTKLVERAITEGRGDCVSRSTLRALYESGPLDYDLELPDTGIDQAVALVDDEGALADAIGDHDTATLIANPIAAGAAK